MANRIKIKKGLQIPLIGESEETLRGTVTSEFVKICPEDFQGVTPKLAVRVNDAVKAGSALFYEKNHPEMLFASPTSGIVTEIERGEKRRILNIVVKADSTVEYKVFGKKEITSLSPEEIRQSILDAGIWFLIKQRPYDIVALPDKQPRDIFVTGFDSAPLAPSYDFLLNGHEEDLQTGLDALTKLTEGGVYLSISTKTTSKSLREAKNVIVTEFDGPHPAGNVGVHINRLKPVNRGEVVWTLNALDVAVIGRLFNKGVTDLTRTIALTGSEIKQTGYY
ncbi:MAG: NADH:ubiquinone reductase (Na(+)-transporting) subunit A, partial [Proteiniphilum sp.]|nr:NADH:ubiquinone reductase (Na(+)-transporting) subunit A [Proteiniphilum sp.]